MTFMLRTSLVCAFTPLKKIMTHLMKMPLSMPARKKNGMISVKSTTSFSTAMAAWKPLFLVLAASWVLARKTFPLIWAASKWSTKKATKATSSWLSMPTSSLWPTLRPLSAWWRMLRKKWVLPVPKQKNMLMAPPRTSPRPWQMPKTVS